MFIVFEGLKRTGKSTQLRKLQLALQKEGHDVVALHTSLLGNKDVTFMKLPKSVKNFAYIAALQQATEQIKQHLADGKIVLADRYIWSQFAYTPLLWGPDTGQEINAQYYADFGVKPDLVFYAHGKLFGEDFLTPEQRKVVAKTFEKWLPLAVVRLDNSRSIIDLHRFVLDTVHNLQSKLKKRSQKKKKIIRGSTCLGLLLLLSGAVMGFSLAVKSLLSSCLSLINTLTTILF